MARKLYCYVDESGQDTEGELFVVAVVLAPEDRDELLRVLAVIEIQTGKGRRKWSKTTRARQFAYIQRVLLLPLLRDKLYCAVYNDTKEYLTLTVQTIRAALSTIDATNYQVTVLIDALPPTQERVVNNLLHRAGLAVKDVRGVRREENDTLIRLADATCGFVRAAHENQPEMRALFERVVRRGILKEVAA